MRKGEREKREKQFTKTISFLSRVKEHPFLYRFKETKIR
jgi:hypothetical protein